MIALIAEKPSVARDIATILGTTQKHDGYLSGNGYMVTWAFGHLVQLAMPEVYGVVSFKKESLPIIPEKFQLVSKQIRVGKEYKPDIGVLKQIKTIKEVFNQCDKIIVATDAGREGELIFRYIYYYLKCNKPFVRLWISSLTDRAIKEGLNNLQPSIKYDNLYYSAKARSEADWLVGINASQALSVAAAQGVFSLGRVQTPTLMMICNRFLENKKFVSTPYFQIKLSTQSKNIPVIAQSILKYSNKHEATTALAEIKTANKVIVKTVEKKETTQEPPLLYDLTTLQKEANTKLNYTADKTLSLAQALYEKKVMSYPRTGSRYISEDVFVEIPERIKLLENYGRFSDYAKGLKGKSLNHRTVNDSKVTDHHALIITENLPKQGELSTEEQTLYEMVAGRMLEAFSDKCIKDITSIILSSSTVDFSVKGTVIKVASWKGVFNEPEKNENEDEQTASSLPALHEGEVLPLIDATILDKQTKPKPLHTESSLLSAMENAGKELENEELKASMKDAGIGTPATRAAIIETLFTRQYIVREKKNLVPTEKGLAVHTIVLNKKISDVEMTGVWENTLSKIELGEVQASTFHLNIIEYTKQITTELLSIPPMTGLSSHSVNQEKVVCPKCKKGTITFFPKVAKCNNADCELTIFKTIAEKSLTDKQILDLLTKKKTGVIKGFKSKAGKTFEVALLLDENYKVVFAFSKS